MPDTPTGYSRPPDPANPPHIICRDLFKIHQHADLEVATLRGLEPTVAPGELLAITGASGKSTPAGRNLPRCTPWAIPESRCG